MAPLPRAIERRPLRFTWIGMACDGVGDKYGGGGVRPCMYDLPHDAVGVDQRLTGVDVMQFSAVNNDLVLVGVEVDRHQFCNQHSFADFKRGIQ